jgi:hypothetical protein
VAEPQHTQFEPAVSVPPAASVVATAAPASLSQPMGKFLQSYKDVRSVLKLRC